MAFIEPASTYTKAPSRRTRRKTPQTSGGGYTVRPGDTLSAIARRLGISLADLIRFNKGIISNPNRINVGQRIRTTAPVAAPAPAPAPKATPTPAATPPRVIPPSIVEPVIPPSPPRVIPPAVGDSTPAQPVSPAPVTPSPGSPTTPTPGPDTQPRPVTTNPVTPSPPATAPVSPVDPEYPEYVDPTPQEPPAEETPSGEAPGEETPGEETPPGLDEAQEDAFAQLATILTTYDLSELFDWAKEAVLNGDPTSKILLELRDQSAYKERFAGMEARRAAGLSAISAEEYLELERRYGRVLRRSGLPDEYQTRAKYAEFIGKDISELELNDRINEGYNRVYQAPEAVREAYRTFYADGDKALLSMFLDPDASSEILLRRARAAEAAGFGSIEGLSLTQDLSEQIADQDLSSEAVRSRFAQVQSQMGLTQETFAEFKDLQAGDVVASVFGTTNASEAREDLRRRRSQRLAAFSGGGGAAYSPGTGFVGFGVADQ